MIVCPMCESQVESGFECEVCGKNLSSMLGIKPPAEVAIVAMVELEVTIPDRVGEVVVERAADVEVTSFEKAGEVTSAPIPDFEKTVADKVGEVAVDSVEDISVDRVPDDGVRTVIPVGPQTCRYCKHVQTVGTMCEKCGMKLPQVAVAAPVEKKKKKVEVWTRCRVCAAPALGGENCRECGREVPMPE